MGIIHKAVENDRYIYCIDRVQMFEQQEENYVIMIGWAFSKSNSESVVRVADTQTALDVQIEQMDRYDVEEVHQQYGDVTECGFEIRFCYKREDSQKPLTLELISPGQSKAQPFFTIILGQLEKYKFKAEMKSSIDHVEYANGRIQVSGWAFFHAGYEECHKVNIRVVDKDKKIKELEKKEVLREDINHLTEQLDVQDRLGFLVSWEAQKNEAYQLELNYEQWKKKYKITSAGNQTLQYLCKKVVKKCMRESRRILRTGNNNYESWERAHRVTFKEMEQQKANVFPQRPKISIIVPAYRTPKNFLCEMIDSVCSQTYANWELCIADGSLDDSISGVLEEYAKADERIKYVLLEDNYGISGNTNGALAIATGDYISLLDHDDVLTPNALYEVVKRINATGAEVLYTDEDKVTMDLKEYFDPNFKPDFNLDYLRSCNYICHFFVVKQTVLEKVGKFHSECDGSQDFDFILRCTSATNKVEHIGKILYHWRCHPNSTAAHPESKMYCYEAGKRAIEVELSSRGIKDAKVAIDEHFGYYRINYPIVTPEKVEIIIVQYLLEEDGQERVEKTIASIKTFTNTKRYQIQVVQIAEKKLPAELNRAFSQTKSAYVVFLEAGMCMTQDNWLEIMLSNCQRSEIAAVGATIWLKGQSIAHSGKIVELQKIAIDLFAGKTKGDTGYTGRMIAQQNVSAISWKGMMVERDTFLTVGGFEEEIQRKYADIDLCLKINQTGKNIVYIPYIGMNITRKDFARDRAENETDKTYMQQKWMQILSQTDPAYSANFDKNGENFTLPF